MFKMAFSLIFTSSPLEQFFVFPRTCFGFSNATFMFCIVAVFIVSVFELNKNTFDFSVLDYFVRSTLVLQKTILSENLNITKLIYFPYYYLLFFFILVANVFGMVPYAYTITSVFHAILYLSVTTMGGITIVGCVANGFKVVGVFLPSGASLLMLPLLMVIEIISYFARVLSLAIRLFANMLSGHVLLKISGGVVWYLLWSPSTPWICSLIPIVLFIAVFILEFVIAALQSYVFSVLIAVYLNDVINLH